MRTTLYLPRKLHLIQNRNPSCTKFLHFIAPQNLQIPYQLDGEKRVHQRLIQLLKEPSEFHSLNRVRVLHALTLTIGPYWNQHIFLLNNIMFKYVSMGEVYLAEKVFDKMAQRNVVSYNTMIKAYSCNGILEESWRLFSEMRYCGLQLTEFTVCGVLSCASMTVVQGFQLLGLIAKNGFLYSSAFVGTEMLSMLGTRGCLDEAVCVFDDMPVKNLVTCNCMISIFGQCGFVENSVFLLLDLMWNGIELSGSTFVGVLSGLTEEMYLGFGEQIHSLVKKYGFDTLKSVSNSLMNMYSKCGNIQLTEKMFQEICAKDIVSWNIIIGSTAKGYMQGKAYPLLLKMCQEGIFPNERTFVSVLNSLNPSMSSYGQYIHAKIIKHAMESDTFVGSALVDFYAKSDSMEDAYLCFVDISDKNIVSWNSLISGFADKDPCVSLLLLQEMIRLGFQPNEFTFSAAVKSCPVLEVQQLHSLITKTGYLDNTYVSSSVISAYAKNGYISAALTFAVTDNNAPLHVVPSNVIAGIYNRTGQYEKTQDLYSALEDPDIVSWNILIAACSRNGDYKEAFELFGHMQRYQIVPDNYTYVSLFSICTKLCNLALGSSLHNLLIKTDFSCCDVFVRNIMIDMYGKCGSLENSLKIFYEMPSKNAISWTSIVSSLGLHGYAYEALEHFKMMETEGFKPDKIAFITVLSACRHVGLVDEGMELFEQMKWKYGIEPEMDHYLVTVDLLARNGLVKEAEKIIASMPFPPDATIWRCFFGGYNRKSRSIMDDQAIAI